MNRNSFAGLGAATLITVFAILCLSIFAALSLSTAKSDTVIADRAADTVSDYYAADTLAQHDRAVLEEAFESLKLTGLDASLADDIETADNAAAEEKLADKADNSKENIEADEIKANEAAYEESAKINALLEKNKKKLHTDNISYDNESGEITAVYPVTDGTTLNVVYGIVSMDNGSSLYVKEWRSVPEEMDIDMSIDVMQFD